MTHTYHVHNRGQISSMLTHSGKDSNQSHNRIVMAVPVGRNQTTIKMEVLFSPELVLVTLVYIVKNGS